MDKLNEIFDMQRALNEEIRISRDLRFDKGEWIQKETLAMLSELAEVLDEARFKWWKNPKPIDEAKLKEELADVLHFFISMCLDAGMTAEELHAIYMAKHEENLRRQRGQSEKPGYAVAELRGEKTDTEA